MRADISMICEAERLARLRLARTESVGPVSYRRLLTRFPDAQTALRELPILARKAGRNAPMIPSTEQILREQHAVHKAGGRILLLDDADYPPLLALLHDPPPALTLVGDAAAMMGRCVAIVGGRNASANGQRMAEQLARALAKAGICVVSGLARGIDTAAHHGTLATQGGLTVAVIAGGVDQPYPPENAALQQRIVQEGGAVVAEMPWGTQPQARHFPRRNRIIAGLALGVVVVEAAPRSGSLITARLAQEAGREIFAMPGSPLDPRSRGSNDLIRQGAYLTETIDDIVPHLPAHPAQEGLARLPLFARPAPAAPSLSRPSSSSAFDTRDDTTPDLPPSQTQNSGADNTQVTQRVLTLLSTTPIPVDDLVRRCQFSTSTVMAALLELELAGRIELLPGHRVALLAGDNADAC